MYPLLSIFSDWALLILRVVMGLIFIVHGWPKIKDLKTVSQNFSAMGFKPGGFWGPLVAIVEFFGGLVLIAGLYAQVIAALFVIQFLVITIWKIAKKSTFVGSLELDVILLAAALALLTLGAGAFSLDRFFLLRF